MNKKKNPENSRRNFLKKGMPGTNVTPEEESYLRLGENAGLTGLYFSNCRQCLPQP
jgi:hypothetical protein